MTMTQRKDKVKMKMHHRAGMARARAQGKAIGRPVLDEGVGPPGVSIALQWVNVVVQ